MPAGIMLNRIMGGLDAVRFAAILGADAVFRTRELRDGEPRDLQPVEAESTLLRALGRTRG